MEVIRNMVPQSKWGIKCPYSITPTRVVVHNTANDAPAENEISYMIRNDNEVSFHYAVDDVKIVQGIEENRNTWSCGDGNGPGNMQGINIEICYSLSGGERFDKAEKRAAQFIAEILKRYGWGMDKVTKHQDYNGKYCPHRTLNKGWQRFLDMVKAYLDDAEADEVKWLFDANSKQWCAKKSGQWLYGWVFDNDKWYYLGEDGYMKTGWAKVKDEWYYLKPDSPDSGRMLTGWLWDKNYNAWYYLKPERGNMAANEYISEPGKMTKYWLDKEGKWVE